MRHFTSSIALALSLAVGAVPVAATGDDQQVAFQIPDFQPEDAQRHTYYVAEIRAGGTSWRAVEPDGEGRLRHSESKQRLRAVIERPEESPAWPTQYYFYSVHHGTGEKLYTFDLVDMRLIDLVTALGVSLTVGPDQTRARRTGSPHEFRDLSVGDRTVTLYGENLTLQQALDHVRAESGCDVFQERAKLVIDWCG